jgi:hypothetical protein
MAREGVFWNSIQIFGRCFSFDTDIWAPISVDPGFGWRSDWGFLSFVRSTREDVGAKEGSEKGI